MSGESARGLLLQILLNGLWQAPILLLAGGIAVRTLARSSAALRHAAWCVVLFAIVTLPVMTSIGVSFPAALQRAPARTEPVMAAAAATPLSIDGEVRSAAPGRVAAVDASRSDSGAPVASAPTRAATLALPRAWMTGLVLGYIAIVTLLLLRVAAGVLRLGDIKRSARLLPERTRATLTHAKHHCGIRRPVRFRSSSTVASPALLGFSRPMLVLPAHHVIDLDDDELMQVAVHELAHLQRRDDWTGLLQNVVQALLFFNPAVRWICDRISLERELACDEWVVGRTGAAPIEYAGFLVRLAEQALASSLEAPAAAALTGSCLRRRVERLLSLDLARMRQRRIRTAVLAAAVLLASLAIVAAAPAVDVIALAGRSANPGNIERDQLLGAPIGGDDGERAPAAAAARLDALFDRMEAAGFSGAVMVVRKDVVLLHRGFGQADRRTGAPFLRDTRFNAGAIAKNLTAAAILRLEQQGRLRLDDRVAKYLGPMPGVKADATLFHLLTHTAGLTPLEQPVYSSDRAAFVGELRAVPADFAPGTSQRHTDIGYSALAAVIEIVSGQPYEQYVRSELIGPAELHATAFEPDVPYSAMAVEYASMRDPGSEVGRRPYVWGRRGAMGAVTTVEDLVRWHRAVETSLFDADTRSRMYDVHLPNAWRSSTGLGWESRISDRGTRVHHVLSGWPGNSVELMHDPASDLVIALSINDRVDWSHPRYDAIARYALGSAASPPASDPASRILRTLSD